MITVYETADGWRVVKVSLVHEDLTIIGVEKRLIAGTVERRYLTTDAALMAETHEDIREALRDIQLDEITAKRRAEAVK